MTTQSKHFNIVKRTLQEYCFPKFVWVFCRPTIADLFKPNQRCGIYVLRFRDDHFYVG